MKKILFVFNPNSGKGQIKNRLLDIVRIFSENGLQVTVYPTRAPKDGYEYILTYGRKFDIIACSGGDGTLNETVGADIRLQLSDLISSMEPIYRLDISQAEQLMILLPAWEFQKTWLRLPELFLREQLSGVI